MNPFNTSPYGAEGWSSRTASSREEIGRLWAPCGVSSEWAILKAVLLHRPGDELDQIQDPSAFLMYEIPELTKCQQEHDRLASVYREQGVQVFYVDPPHRPPPNQMFVADLMFMTPEGAILARPASTVRAGEERHMARKLAELGVPVLRMVRGRGTFEGADAAWVDHETVLIGRGLRTNQEGITQLLAILNEIGVHGIVVDLPYGVMHLMGVLRFVDRDLAIGWPNRLPYTACEAVRSRGYELIFLPDKSEAVHGMALNFVTLGPRAIVMPDGSPVTRKFYEKKGVTCHCVPLGEIMKAAGGIGCLTGILHREPKGKLHK